MRIFSFPPIADEKSKVLILGTMPGKESLRMNQYYANSRNAFWKIIFRVFNQPLMDDYKKREELLINKGVALWDVLKACERESSLDSDILSEEVNDFKSLFRTSPQIAHIFFNGKPAYNYFNRMVKESVLSQTILPSTSSAHTIPFDSKLKEWMRIVKQL